jgi:hypothetical protein
MNFAHAEISMNNNKNPDGCTRKNIGNTYRWFHAVTIPTRGPLAAQCAAVCIGVCGAASSSIRAQLLQSETFGHAGIVEASEAKVQQCNAMAAKT